MALCQVVQESNKFNAAVGYLNVLRRAMLGVLIRVTDEQMGQGIQEWTY